MGKTDITGGYWKSLRLYAVEAVLTFDDDAVKLGSGTMARRDTFDTYSKVWRKVELRVRLGEPLPRQLGRPEMVWAGMARFLGSVLMSSADLLDFDSVASTYAELWDDFGG